MAADDLLGQLKFPFNPGAAFNFVKDLFTSATKASEAIQKAKRAEKARA